MIERAHVIGLIPPPFTLTTILRTSRSRKNFTPSIPVSAPFFGVQWPSNCPARGTSLRQAARAKSPITARRPFWTLPIRARTVGRAHLLLSTRKPERRAFLTNQKQILCNPGRSDCLSSDRARGTAPGPRRKIASNVDGSWHLQGLSHLMARHSAESHAQRESPGQHCGRVC